MVYGPMLGELWQGRGDVSKVKWRGFSFPRYRMHAAMAYWCSNFEFGMPLFANHPPTHLGCPGAALCVPRLLFLYMGFRRCDSPPPINDGLPCPGNATKLDECYLRYCLGHVEPTLEHPVTFFSEKNFRGSWIRASRNSLTEFAYRVGTDELGDNADDDGFGGRRAIWQSALFFPGRYTLRVNTNATYEQEWYLSPQSPDYAGGLDIPDLIGHWDNQTYLRKPSQWDYELQRRARFYIRMPERVNNDGLWGEWTDVGRCSQPCNRGLHEQERRCDSPAPQHGGAYCEGPSRRNRTCITRWCQDPEPTDTHPMVLCRHPAWRGCVRVLERDEVALFAMQTGEGSGSDPKGSRTHTFQSWKVLRNEPVRLNSNMKASTTTQELVIPAEVADDVEDIESYLNAQYGGRRSRLDSILYTTWLHWQGEFSVQAPPFDYGNWTAWTPATRCSQFCGPGNATYTRSCRAGLACEGPTVKSDFCFLRECEPNWGTSCFFLSFCSAGALYVTANCA